MPIVYSLRSKLVNIKVLGVFWPLVQNLGGGCAFFLIGIYFLFFIFEEQFGIYKCSNTFLIKQDKENHTVSLIQFKQKIKTLCLILFSL